MIWMIGIWQSVCVQNMNKNNFKILFVNPQSVNKDALPIPPLGVLYLSSYLKHRGINNITVLDNNYYKYNNNQLRKFICENDIICVTGTTSQYKEAVDISYLAFVNNRISIFGGPHASAVPANTMNESLFDIVVVGEGEETLYEIISNIQHESSVLCIHNLYNISGIYFRDKHNIVHTRRRRMLDINSLPFPDRDSVDIVKYGQRELKRFDGPYTHMMSSRGCGSACTFCSSPQMWGSGRLRSSEMVFGEMLDVYRKYNIKNIHFQDDNFIASEERVVEICNKIIKSGIDFHWSCQARPTGVGDNVLSKMKQAGCVQIEFGVESGDEKILLLAKKGYTKKQIKRAFELTKKHGILTYGFFIIGLPGETLLTWVKSIIFAKQLKLDSCVWTILVPFPGTQIYNKDMVKILDKNYTNWLYKSPIIKSGKFGPVLLKIMRYIADRLTNGFFNKGTYKE